ncbi:hypothetical protein [Halobacterium sp. R2-5]|uniref:hypothetical protein n=1 Tax=Halobacterium sp. R2-5 TaxID=2715751 RepID=UPI00141E75A7|nr:hypothetical protein [Halobacterium sp. R2-5]NIC00913.1 hypothetical protein [Halobacterium sp. R2-5]
MVEVVEEGLLSRDIRDQSKYREFPEEEYDWILNAVQDASDSVFDGHGEDLDGHIAEILSDYAFEHDGDSGRDQACKLWAPKFNHTVDFYHPEKRIAIEVEKTQQKRVSDDILKFIKGGKTQHQYRQKIEFGCLVVPVNYGIRSDRSSTDNLFKEAMQNMEFVRSVLHVEDIAVIGYRIPAE